MGIENFFKGLLAGLSASSRDDILRKFSHTRLGEHYDQVESLCINLPRNTTWIFVGLLLFGNDDMYLDILDFAVTFKLQRVYDYFKIISDRVTLEVFMDDLVPPSDKKRKTEIFVGEADEATVLVGEQTTDSSYLGNNQVKVLQFSDAQEMNVLDLADEADDTRRNEDNLITANLGDFLKRPEIIQQFQWVPGSNFINATNSVFFTPYGDYLNTTAVRRKIDQYRLFRCTGLKLQFRINGSPFHYGRLYACWRPGTFRTLPYAGQGNPYDVSIAPDNMGTLNGTTFPLLTHYSQIPGVFIDPATNEPQELIVPFMWNQNYISLVSSQEFLALGQICLFAMNPLRHANGATSAITVTVTAEFIDPVLSVPTVKQAFTGESDIVKTKKGKAGSGANAPSKARTKVNNDKSSNDEYGKGAVSAPATALANFAGTLEKVPIIGAYATATKIAANGVASVAKLFGYSNPVNLETANPVTLHPCGSLATTIGSDTCQKLTLDPKQEITVDPHVVGLQNIDEMTFAHLFKRESLLVQIPWTEAAAGQSVLANIAVGPWNKPISNFAGVLFHTALSWASFPFIWWRGSLKYRFQIVASQNHRGRLAIVYNPNEGTTVLPPQVITYQYFMDLAETRDMTVTIRHASQSAWLVNNPPSSVFITGAGHTFTDEIKLASNGVLSVYVLNELGAPINTADVTINVFISAGDDFMVAGPGSPGFEKYTPYALALQVAYGGGPARPAFEGESDEMTTNEAAPMSMTNVIINGDEMHTPDVDNVNMVFFGEQIVSLRALLKRYCFYTSYPTGVTGASELTRFRVRHGPRPMSRAHTGRGNDMIGTVDAIALQYNAVFNTFIDYYSRGYAAYRGSIRWKYNLVSSSNLQIVGAIRARRFPQPLNAVDRYTRLRTFNISGTLADTESVRIGTYLDEGAPNESYTGTCLGYVRMKNLIEFEHPFYSSQRFHWISRDTPNITQGNQPNGVYYHQAAVEIRDSHEVDYIMPAAANSSAGQIEAYCAAGEDFSLHYFVAAPVVGFSDYIFAV